MTSLFRILRYGAQGFRRNIWLSVIAIITMTLTLTTLTVFALGDLVANKQYQEFNQKIDYLIFIKDSASDTDVNSFYTQLEARPEVQSSVLYSKADVLKKFQASFKQDSLKGVVSSDNNPLPREVDVKFHDPKQIDTFDKFISQDRFQQIVENTSYVSNRGSIDNYIRSTNVLRIFGIFFSLFFVIIAVLVILNTIRLAIFSRREEIEIMRLVGATSGYIRGPFLIEGMLFGLLGALFSAVLFWLLLHQLQLVLVDSQHYGTTNFINDLFSSALSGITNATGFNLLYAELVGAQMIVGIVLGVFCSWLAARRYLRE